MENLSLNQLFNLRCPPEERQPHQDVEDMVYSKATLGTQLDPGLIDSRFEGRDVKIVSVGIDNEGNFTGQHRSVLWSEREDLRAIPFTFPNDARIYRPPISREEVSSI